MATLQQRHNKFRAKVRIPKKLRDRHGNREFLYRTLTAMDRPSAKAEADAWEAGMRSEWLSIQAKGNANRTTLRSIYEEGRKAALAGEYLIEMDGEDDPAETGIEFEIDKLAEEVGARELSEAETARLGGLQDALSELQGKPLSPRPEMELSLSELADQYLDLWATQGGLKPTNTRQQKEATFRLFSGYIKDRPIREVRKAEAAGFMDELRRLDPKWAKSPKAKEMSWAEIRKTFGGNDKGLSASTLNRHVRTLQELWRWAEEREYCEGRNPFSGLTIKLKAGRNQLGYLPWTADELNTLFDPPPARQDVTEVMVVALHTGMRLNEIASLTLSQIKQENGVHYIEVEDAKTEAGNRQVPIHPRIGWLAELEGKPESRVWAGFNQEGPSRNAGQDASKEFSRFKLAKGFTDRRKVFHSFRKNVTQIMERKGVSENEWAQVLGHERGFTYSRYSPHGITLERKAELIGLIDYPEVQLPEPPVVRG
uniref:tyrosine-type recombinase/integrase n=1 Tax=uncultured Altererythrobacter sp. TaxID=500840 RepID=UPI0026271A1B|nr:tyrosine-type recombinase/integrase [uncultured Altererythrobacter sp.]